MKKLAEMKEYKIPNFDLDLMNEVDHGWVAREMVWLIRNHPDHPTV